MPRDFAHGRRAAASGAAALMLWATLPMPAAFALGENGPFELPLQDVAMVVDGDKGATMPLDLLIETSALPDLRLESATLELPEDTSASARGNMRLSEDGTMLVVRGQGVWSISDSTLNFEPDSEFNGVLSPIALTVASRYDTRSYPAVIDVISPQLTTHHVSSSEGQTITVDLTEENPDAESGTARLTLDGMPAGSSVTSDGRRMVVLDQGTWELSEDRREITFTPLTRRLGGSPTPAHYEVIPADGGEPTSVGEVSISTPYIQDMNRSAPYGQPIVFSMQSAMRSVEPSTLRLRAVPGAPGVTVSADGTTARAAQGEWTLDRENALVTFTPDDEGVVVTAPMGITGADADGNETSLALLRTGYPSIADLSETAPVGSPVVFQPLQNSRDVRADTLRFSEDTAPEGAAVDEDDGLSMTVPGEGRWSIDTSAGTVTFTPQDGLPPGDPTPVVIHASGVYADVSTAAVLTPQIGAEIPVLRDDEMRVPPGQTSRLDVLVTDTPASPAQPFVPDSLQIRSIQAVNLDQLAQWKGNRLVVPRQGVYEVEADGIISFTPEPGFIGSTTPIEYTVLDTAGMESQGWVTFDVDPTVPVAEDSRPAAGAYGTLLTPLTRLSSASAVGYAAVTLLTAFAGLTSLWIGVRMEKDRRELAERGARI